MLLQLDIDTFSKMLLSSEVNVKSEKVVFESIMKYAERHKKDGKEKMDAIYSTLLPCLRFNLFPMKFVVEELEFHPQLKHLPVSSYPLHHSAHRLIYSMSWFMNFIDGEHTPSQRRGSCVNTEKVRRWIVTHTRCRSQHPH